MVMVPFPPNVFFWTKGIYNRDSYRKIGCQSFSIQFMYAANDKVCGDIGERTTMWPQSIWNIIYGVCIYTFNAFPWHALFMFLLMEKKAACGQNLGWCVCVYNFAQNGLYTRPWHNCVTWMIFLCNDADM